MKILFLLLIAAALVAGQDTPTFRTGARLVEVQAVVTGRGGVPVEGLTEADFTIEENGKRQKIAFFAPPRAVANERAEPLPAGLFTNRTGYASSAPGTVVAVVLDVLNTRSQDQYFARAALARFVKQLRGDERVGLYVLGQQLRVIHDFTDDPESLLRLTRRLRNEWPAGSAGAEEQARAEARVWNQMAERVEWEDAASGTDDMARITQEQRIRATLAQMEMLGQHMAGVPGRKSLVWLSTGMPMMTVNFSPMPGPGGAPIPHFEKFRQEYARAVQRLADANVAVYPVDARGLRIESDAPMFQPNLGRAGGAGRSSWAVNWAKIWGEETLSAMNELAEGTGGRVYVNANDLETGIQRAAEDQRASYTLGYNTSLEDDDRRRELRVRVNRRGVEVLARRRVPAGTRTGLLEVRDLLESPVAATGIPLNARMTRSGEQLRVVLQIEPGSLLWTRQGARTAGVVEVYLAQIRPGGERVVADARLDLKLSEAEVARVSAEGLMYERMLALDGQAERLRVVVRDGRSGMAGSLDAPLRQMPVE